MKRIITLSVILLLVCQSCIYFDIEPTIIQKLSEEELAVVPYKKGQQFNMVNQNNDTILWIVNEDTISLNHNYYHHYNRHIGINALDNSQTISMDLKPDKQLNIVYTNADGHNLYYNFFFDEMSPRTIVIDNDTLYNVHVSAGDSSNQMIYSISQGIIRIQKDSNYLQLIP